MIRIADVPETHLAYAHLSTLGSAPLADFKATVREMQQHAHLITLTEMLHDDRVAWLKTLPGWMPLAYTDDAKGECAILYNRQFLALRSADVHPLTTLQVRTGDGHLRPPVALNKVILRHRATQRNVVVSALHQVSGIEDGIRNWLNAPTPMSAATLRASDHRLAVALDVFRNLRRRNQIIRRNHPHAAKLQAGDFNLNLESDLLRGFVEDVIGMNFPQRQYARIAGTHGSRTIDGVLLEGCRHVGLVQEFQSAASDHDGINGVVDLGGVR